MRASPSRVAARHMASQDVVAVGDLAVFPPINDNYKYWRGSSEPVLEYGEYVAAEPEPTLYYARHFAGHGYIAGYKIPGHALDATSNPRRVLEDASGLDFDLWDEDHEYTEAWEVLENIPGIEDALVDRGYTLIEFYDAVPSRILAYKYIGDRTIRGDVAAKVVSPADIRKYLPPLCRKLWGDAKALPATEKGWLALGDAQWDVMNDIELEEPDYYLSSVVTSSKSVGWWDLSDYY